MKVFIFYSTAGEGHKKIGEAIAEEFRSQNAAIDVRTFDALGWGSALVKKGYTGFYFFAVKYASSFWWLLYESSDRATVYRWLKPIREWWNQIQSKSLRGFVHRENPDIIISTHFYAAQVFASAKRRKEITSRLITVLTDVMPHTFWVNDGTDIYWVMAEESKSNLIKRGVRAGQIIVGGIPIRKEFSIKEDRKKLNEKFRFNPNGPIVLFTSGSFGVGPTEALLEELGNFSSKIQVVVICGQNEALYHRLSSQKFSFPIIIAGFVTNMHEYMSIADILIAKPGGSTTCESLAKELPMLISAPIPGQETRNAAWLLNKGASFEIKKRGDLTQMLKRILDEPTKLETAKEKIRMVAKPKASSDLVQFLMTSFDDAKI